MRRYIVYILLALLMPLAAVAQSMTDDQVMAFVAKEHAAGTSNAQIVTKLMQRGVDISQIRRVRTKYESQMNQGSMSSMSGKSAAETSRMRTNNGKTRNDYGKKADAEAAEYSSQRVKAQPDRTYTHTYDDNDEEYVDFQKEMAAMVSSDKDSLAKSKNRVFGRDIFNSKLLSFEPNMNIATPQNYRLGPGDAVIIDIYGASQKTEQCTVSPDGDVTIEGYGPVQVSGLTVAQANARLRSTLGSRYTSSRVRLTVGQTRTIMVNVMGEVRLPGTYTLSAFATVFHALYMAGGTNDLGTLRNIKVYRSGRLVTVVDIYDYILNGRLTGNVRLAEGDVIVVGPYDCLVNISGKVKRPMFYEMKKNESVASLLKYAGSFTGDAYTKAVRVNRKTGREYSVYNVGEFDYSSFQIADGDSVEVDSILSRFANTVEVRGAVFRPGKYNLGGQVNSVRTLLAQAEGVTEKAFTARAVMHRLKADRSLEAIRVDVAGIMSGRVADIPLKENDVLFIPTRPEEIQERTITIRGEVNYPGTYRYAENETVEDFVLQAGGLTDRASSVNVYISRRITDPKALRPDSVIAQTFTVSLKDGFAVDGQPEFKLMPFDEVYVMRSPAYSKQQNVSVEGEVVFAGMYTLPKYNVRLGELFRKSGGSNGLAYIKGARLMRRANETEKERMRAVLRMQQEQLQKNLLQLSTSSNNAGGLQQAAEGAKNAACQVQCARRISCRHRPRRSFEASWQRCRRSVA